MKFLIAVFLVLAALAISAVAHADSDSANGSSAPVTGRGKRGGGKKPNPNPSAGNPDSVRGTCTVIESPSNPIAGPCVTTMLVLNDIDGNEIAKDRTTAQGQFEFTAERGKAYKIAPGSKYYNLVSPTTAIHGGDKINLQLQQKE